MIRLAARQGWLYLQVRVDVFRWKGTAVDEVVRVVPVVPVRGELRGDPSTEFQFLQWGFII